MKTILEIAVLGVVGLAAGMTGGMIVASRASDVPTMTAITLGLLPGLVAHLSVRWIGHRDPANHALWALAGSGIRLLITLIGALLVACTASWGTDLTFWVPLAATYLAILAAELLMTLGHVQAS